MVDLLLHPTNPTILELWCEKQGDIENSILAKIAQWFEHMLGKLRSLAPQEQLLSVTPLSVTRWPG